MDHAEYKIRSKKITLFTNIKTYGNIDLYTRLGHFCETLVLCTLAELTHQVVAVIYPHCTTLDRRGPSGLRRIR
jgi:hypothetical protein